MNIHRVRMRFQHSWDFIVTTNALLTYPQALYSLQQESLNSIDMFLYVTNEDFLELEGHVIEAKGQRWIVAESFKEVVNTSLWEYKLIPVVDTLTLVIKDTSTNALGVIADANPPIELTVDCGYDDYTMKARDNQPIEAYQQVFLVATKAMAPGYDKATYFTYQGRKYGIDSFESLAGVVKIRATEDL